MENKSIAELAAPVFNGEIHIADWWNNYGNVACYFDKFETDDDVATVSALFHRMGVHMAEKGYFQDSLRYFDRALEIIDAYSYLMSTELFLTGMENILEAKAHILMHLGKYREALTVFKHLKKLFPVKDAYKVHQNTCFGCLINKFATPIYTIIIIFWAIYGICEWWLDLNFFPHIVFDVSWFLWMAVFLTQICAPGIYRLFNK